MAEQRTSAVSVRPRPRSGHRGLLLVSVLVLLLWLALLAGMALRWV